MIKHPFFFCFRHLRRTDSGKRNGLRAGHPGLRPHQVDRGQLLSDVPLPLRRRDHGLRRPTRYHDRGRVPQRRHRVRVYCITLLAREYGLTGRGASNLDFRRQIFKRSWERPT